MRHSIGRCEIQAARPVLVVHSSDELYGSDRMLMEFIRALPAGLLERVVVWLPTDVPHRTITLCGSLAEMGVDVAHVDLPVVRRQYLTPVGMASLARRAASVRRRLAEVQPGLLVLGTTAVLPVAHLLPRGHSAEVVLYLQEVWEGWEARVLGWLARPVDRVVAISDAARASLPAPVRARATVVPNATPEPWAWSPVASDGGELVFVVASRWMPWKGHHVLLQAWDEAGSPGRLVILGGPPDVGASTDVRALAAASAFPSSIAVVGEVSDPDPYVRAADVMVVPSVRDEPFGLVTIEAFARGRPVIGSRNGGLRETIAEGSGWLVPPGDVHALADRLRTLTRADVVAAGSAARLRYEQRYSQQAFRTALRSALGLSGDDP